MCRSGVEIWAGSVTALEPSLPAFNGSVTAHIGRRGRFDQYKSAVDGDWQVNDIIVPSSTSCPRVSYHGVCHSNLFGMVSNSFIHFDT